MDRLRWYTLPGLKPLRRLYCILRFGNMIRQLATMSACDAAQLMQSLQFGSRVVSYVLQVLRGCASETASLFYDCRADYTRLDVRIQSFYNPQGDWRPEAIRHHGNTHSARDLAAQR
jgi:hypothetical protein